LITTSALIRGGRDVNLSILQLGISETSNVKTETVKRCVVSILDDCGVADLTKEVDTVSTYMYTVSKIPHPSIEYTAFTQ